jgi:hypothetical protein
VDLLCAVSIFERIADRPRDCHSNFVAVTGLLPTGEIPYCSFFVSIYFPDMRDESLQFLETLVNTPSPSGHEYRGQRIWMEYVKQYADETYSDSYGNCVAVLNKGGSPRVMLAGHADEIGMTVNYISD